MKYKRLILSLGVLILLTLLGIWGYSKLELLRAFLSLKDLESVHIEGNVRLFLDNHALDLKGSANYHQDVLSATLTTDYVWNPIMLEFYVKIEDSSITFYLLQNLSTDCFKSNQRIKEVEWKKVNFKKKDIKIKKVVSDRTGEKKYEVFLLKEGTNRISFSIYVRNSKVTGILSKEKIYLSKEKNIYFSDFDVKLTSWNQVTSFDIPIDRVESCQELDKKAIKEIFF